MLDKETSQTRHYWVAKDPSARFACSGQAATHGAARLDPSRDEKRLAQDDMVAFLQIVYTDLTSAGRRWGMIRARSGSGVDR
jgi:hypothetical protein